MLNRAYFTESGTWLVPDGITHVMLIGCGGGGGGAGGAASGLYANGGVMVGQGGAGGGSAMQSVMAVIVGPGQAINIIIGAGGVAGTGGEPDGYSFDDNDAEDYFGSNGEDGLPGEDTKFGNLATFSGASGGYRGLNNIWAEYQTHGSLVGGPTKNNNGNNQYIGYIFALNYGSFNSGSFTDTLGQQSDAIISTMCCGGPSIRGGATGDIYGGYPGGKNVIGGFSGGGVSVHGIDHITQGGGWSGGGGAAGPQGNGTKGGDGGDSGYIDDSIHYAIPGHNSENALNNTGAGGGGGGGAGAPLFIPAPGYAPLYNSPMSGGLGGNGGSGYLYILY